MREVKQEDTGEIQVLVQSKKKYRVLEAGLCLENWRNRRKSVLLDQSRNSRSWIRGNRNPQVVGCYKDFNFDEDRRSLKVLSKRVTWHNLGFSSATLLMCGEYAEVEKGNRGTGQRHCGNSGKKDRWPGSSCQQSRRWTIVRFGVIFWKIIGKIWWLDWMEKVGGRSQR